MLSPSTVLGAALLLAKANSVLAQAECAPYNDATVSAALPNFPPIWQPVTGLLAGDAEGKALFSSFSSKIPNIQPKGTNGVPDPNFAYASGDPDCWWTNQQCVQPKAAGVKADVAWVPEPQTLGYGFDDGPNCSHNAFYDYMLSHKQKATFFYIGSNVMDWPHEAQRAITDGHHVCVHTWSHRSMTAFTNEQVFAELWYTLKAIKLVTGYTPTCWRPPLGDTDDRVRFIAQQMNLTNVMWQYDSFDWEAGSNGVTPAQVQQNYNNLVAAANAGKFADVGAIILAHELDNYTMQTAVDNYPNLTKAFKHIVPIAVALNQTQPYAEANFSMPNFNQYIGVADTSSASPSVSASGSASASAPSGSSKSSAGSVSSSNSNSTASGKSGAVSTQLTHMSSIVASLALIGAAAFLL